MSITDDKIKAIQEHLKNQSKTKPKSNNSKIDVVRASYEHIDRLRQKGFSFEDIAAEIAKVGGFSLSAATLKNYIQRVKIENGSAPTRRKASGVKSQHQETKAAKTPNAHQQEAQVLAPGKFSIKKDRANI